MIKQALLVLAAVGTMAPLSQSARAEMPELKAEQGTVFSLNAAEAAVVIVQDLDAGRAEARVTARTKLGCTIADDLAVAYQAKKSKSNRVTHSLEVLNIVKKMCVVGNMKPATLFLGNYPVDLSAKANRFFLNGQRIPNVVVYNKGEEPVGLPMMDIVRTRLSLIKVDLVKAAYAAPFYTENGMGRLDVSAIATASNKCFVPARVVSLNRTLESENEKEETWEYSLYQVQDGKVCTMIYNPTQYRVEVAQDVVSTEQTIPEMVSVNGTEAPVNHYK